MLNLFQDEYIKKIEQILKELYKFYKNSSKRKKALNATTSRQEKSLTALIDTMISEVKQGKEDLKQTTSLQLKKWNATRWLGRETCLKAICKAYEHLLEHLHEVSNMKSETASVKQTSRDLYNKLTSFDVFLFIFLYRDFASTLGTYSRYIQDRNLGIRDVGRRITSLSLKLRSNYPRDSLLPVELIGDGTADAILLELFGNDMTRLLEMEAALQPPERPVEIPVSSGMEINRSTRKRDVSSSYASLLSRRTREERERENNMETESVQDQSETEFTLTWRGHDIRGKGSYFGPWKRMVEFASLVDSKIAARFPRTAFLAALDVVDPREWAMAHDRNSAFSMPFILYLLIAKNGNSRPSFSRSSQLWKPNFICFFLPRPSEVNSKTLLWSDMIM